MVLAEKFCQKNFSPKIAYLADIFDSLNCLNLSTNENDWIIDPFTGTDLPQPSTTSPLLLKNL